MLPLTLIICYIVILSADMSIVMIDETQSISSLLVETIADLKPSAFPLS
jgi:hypothetical protein